jgi:hypothetical protein
MAESVIARLRSSMDAEALLHCRRRFTESGHSLLTRSASAELQVAGAPNTTGVPAEVAGDRAHLTSRFCASAVATMAM